MASRSAALASYRQLLRIQRKSFKGDAMMLSNAYNETRAQYEQNRSVSDPATVQQMIDDAAEAASFISGYIVQGVMNERGNLAVTIDRSMVIPASELAGEPEGKGGP